MMVDPQVYADLNLTTLLQALSAGRHQQGSSSSLQVGAGTGGGKSRDEQECGRVLVVGRTQVLMFLRRGAGDIRFCS